MQADSGVSAIEAEKWIWAVEDIIGFFGSLPSEFLTAPDAPHGGWSDSMVSIV